MKTILRKHHIREPQIFESLFCPGSECRVLGIQCLQGFFCGLLTTLYWNNVLGQNDTYFLAIHKSLFFDNVQQLQRYVLPASGFVTNTSIHIGNNSPFASRHLKKERQELTQEVWKFSSAAQITGMLLLAAGLRTCM